MLDGFFLLMQKRIGRRAEIGDDIDDEEVVDAEVVQFELLCAMEDRCKVPDGDEDDRTRM